MKKQIKDVISAEFKGLWGTDFSDDGIPVIKTNNMTYEGRIDYSDICLRNITSEEAEENFLCNGDLIIEKSGGTKTHSVGYVNIFEGEDNKYVCNNFILPIRPNRDLVNPKYLFWQLHGMYEAGRFSDCFNKTTGIQNLQKKTYFSKEINVPTLPEQQKIAAHLDSIQSAIDNKKQQLAQLDELVKSKFVEMFGENPVESGKWKVEKIESVVDRKILTAKKKFQKTNKIKYVDISAIDNKTNLVTGFTEYVLEDAPSRAQQAINCDDILISTVRPNLRNIAINPFNDSSMVGSSGFCVLRVNETCNARYLFHCVLGDDFTNAMVDLTTGAAYPAIKDSDVLAYSITVPPIELQNTFAEYVQKIDSAKSIIKTQLEDLQELLDSKMDEYFGE